MPKELTKCTNLVEARLLQSFLRSLGIEPSIPDEHTLDVSWHITPAFNGVRIWVEDEDYNLAKNALEGYYAGDDLIGEFAEDLAKNENQISTIEEPVANIRRSFAKSFIRIWLGLLIVWIIILVAYALFFP